MYLTYNSDNVAGGVGERSDDARGMVLDWFSLTIAPEKDAM